MNVQIGQVELQMEDLFLYGNEVHVSNSALVELARKYNVQIQYELCSSTSTEYPHRYFVIIDGIKFYGCFKIDWLV